MTTLTQRTSNALGALLCVYLGWLVVQRYAALPISVGYGAWEWGNAAPLERQTEPQQAAPVALDTPGDLSQLQHAPTITAAQIDKVLADYGSPATGMGQVFYDEGVKHGINPAVALAFYIHESSAGTAGAAIDTRSIGNIICAGWSGRCIGRFRAYNTYADAIDDWYNLIRDEYISEGRTTVDRVIPKYAPAADNNDEAAYIAAVNNLVRQWAQQGQDDKMTGGKANAPLDCPLARCYVNGGYTFNASSHPGIDWAAALNEPVHTTVTGRANVSPNSWPGGNCVEVFAADGLSTLACHLNSFAVQDGQEVTAGDVIGGAGATGLATGVHVHFEVRRNGISIDPRSFR